MTDGTTDQGPAPWRPSGRQVVGSIVVVLLLVFAFVNLEDATIDFVFTQVQVPVFFVITVPALLGFAAGLLFRGHQDRRRRRRR